MRRAAEQSTKQDSKAWEQVAHLKYHVSTTKRPSSIFWMLRTFVTSSCSFSCSANCKGCVRQLGSNQERGEAAVGAEVRTEMKRGVSGMAFFEQACLFFSVAESALWWGGVVRVESLLGGHSWAIRDQKNKQKRPV